MTFSAEIHRVLLVVEAQNAARAAGARLGRARKWNHSPDRIAELTRELAAARDALAKAKSLCG